MASQDNSDWRASAGRAVVLAQITGIVFVALAGGAFLWNQGGIGESNIMAQLCLFGFLLFIVSLFIARSVFTNGRL